jgi:hypothetical protein
MLSLNQMQGRKFCQKGVDIIEETPPGRKTEKKAVSLRRQVEPE